MFWRPRRQLATICPHDDARPDFCEHPRAICTARNFGEPSSAPGTFRQPGPAYVPVLLASLLLIFGVLLIFTAGRAPSLSSLRWTEWRHALAILAACVFAVFAIE